MKQLCVCTGCILLAIMLDSQSLSDDIGFWHFTPQVFPAGFWYVEALQIIAFS